MIQPCEEEDKEVGKAPYLAHCFKGKSGDCDTPSSSLVIKMVVMSSSQASMGRSVPMGVLPLD